MTTYTPSGVRRAGDDYQDIVALDMLVSMLEHPDRYEWVRVEADEYGYLDDVAALRRDGTIEVKQVKFSAHPDKADDPYDWKALTEKRKGKKGAELPSLVGKWGPTLLDMLDRHSRVEAALVTNRRAAPDLSRCFGDGTSRILPERLPGDVMLELSKQLGGDDKAVRFLTNFDFKLDSPDLATWESGIFRKFARLGGEREGWLNLKDCLRTWARQKSLPGPDGHICLGDVRRAALWNRLVPMPQGFAIPEDYVLPSRPQHAALLKRLSVKSGACIVVSGTPGIGKSTYLSVLLEELRKQKRPVIRHHYFLSLDDTTVGRFEHAKVIESLMAELQAEVPEALGPLAAQNPGAKDFPQWLDACSAYCSGKQFPLVVIIDGLDHVWREDRNTVELTRLFDNLLPCRPGVCLLVGTQPLAAEHLPKKLLDAAPVESWLVMSPLDRQSVLEWTRKNEKRLDFRHAVRPEDREDELKEIAGAFYDASQGQPLLLHYGLNALIEAGLPVNARTIGNGARGVAGNINDYYQTLWNGLGREGKFMLCLVASAGFEWPQNGIVACCARYGIEPLNADRCWQQVVHLMCRVRLGWLPFHSSMNVFVAGTSEYGEFLKQVQPAIALWLAEDAPEYWRFAYEWKIKAECGDNDPLLKGTTRQWVIDSLAKGFPRDQVCELLGRAARTALASGDLRSFAHKALLYEYVNDSFNLTIWESQAEWTSVQLACKFAERLPDVLLNRKGELTNQQLAALGEALRSNGEGDEVGAIVDELIDRVNTQGRNGISHDWITEVTPVVWTETLLSDIPANKIANRIRNNRDHIDPARFSRVYAEALRAHRRADLLRDLCGADLAVEERRHFLKQGFLHAIEEGLDWSDIARTHGEYTYSSIYGRVKGLSGYDAPSGTLPKLDILAKSGREMEGQNSDLATWLIDCYDIMLSHYLWGKDKIVQEWLSGVGDFSWPRLFVQRLSSIAKSLSVAILAHARFTIGDMYKLLAELAPPKFNESSSDHGFWLTARRVLTELGLDNMILVSSSAAPCIERDDVETAFDSPHCYWNDWIVEYVGRRRVWLSAGALEWISEKFGAISGVSIEDMTRDGVSDATALAGLMARHGRADKAYAFLARAIDLTIRYGGRKDILLHDYVDTITQMAGRFPDKARQAIAPVIPAILHIMDYTDGKETRHVPGMLYDLLATLAPAWLPSIYQHLCGQESYYEAADAFGGLIKSLSFATPVEVALGATCLDQNGLDELVVRAGQGCPGAQQALESVRKLIGTNPFEASVNKEKEQIADPALKAADLPKAADYPLDKVQEYWRALRSCGRGMGTEELKEWTAHWEAKASPAAVRDALMSLHDVEEYAEVTGIIHELTVRLQGRSSAWPWLVKAHREVNGWGAHWADKKPAVEKWEVVRRYYPEQWHAFIVETMEPGRRFWDGFGIHGRFPRLVEYLLLLGKEDHAWGVLQGVCEVIEGLVAPLGITAVDWAGDRRTKEEQILDVLLTRMTWPSGMVRERACNSLAELLSDATDGGRTRDVLIRWIGERKLEAQAYLGLLPFVRARQIKPDLELVDTGVLRSVCPRPSILYEILLEELQPGSWKDLPCGVGHAGTAPDGFHPCAKLIKSRRVLPEIYKVKAESIERRFGMRFTQQWAYEVERAVGGFQDAPNSVDFYGRSDGKHYVSFDTPLSDGLRSGYLRALAWLAEQGEEHRFWAWAEALGTLPIDLGLWCVAPQERPKWWPQLKSAGATDIDPTPTSILEALDAFWLKRRDDQWVLGMASGRVAEGGSHYDLEVFGIFQKCLGPDAPAAEAVWESDLWWRKKILLDPISARFGGTLVSTEDQGRPLQVNDWMMCSSVLTGHPHVSSQWQWWRMIRGVWLPLPALAQDGNYVVECMRDRIVFQDKEGELGYWQDWTAGLSEMLDANLTPRNGQVLFLRRSAVDKYAADNGLTFCLVCRIRGFSRKYGVGNYKETCVYRIIGANNLII